MSSSFLRTLALILALITARAEAAPALPGAAADPHAAVRQLLQPWDRPDRPGAAVTITLDGRLVESVAVGMADLEQPQSVGPTSVFHVASLSKQFTAFAVLMLEQDGKLSIDDRLTKYIPETAPLGPLTLRQLLNHTSGLRDQWTLLAAAGWRAEDLVTDGQVMNLLLRQRGGNFVPGTQYQYTNSGYSLLAEVVRRVSGKSLRAFSDERIFRPLGMSHTHFQDDLDEQVAGRALSYQLTKGAYVRSMLNYATVGPTGLQTTAEDLSRWALNFETPSVGGPTVIRRMEEQGVLADSKVDAYALGQERREYKGMDTWSHGGRDAGYRSFLLRIPGERFSVAVLGNATDFDTAKIAFAVADIYLSKRPAYRASKPAEARHPSPAEAAAYAGEYELFPGLIFHIINDKRRLFIQQLGSKERTELPAVSANAFQLDPKNDIAIEFPTGNKGPAASFNYRIGLHGSLEAKRVRLAPFSPDTIALADFTGRYYSTELDTTYELRVEHGQLLAYHPRRPAISLQPYQKDMFASPESFFQKLSFQRDSAGRVTGFQLSGVVAENIGFVRTTTIALDGHNVSGAP